MTLSGAWKSRSSQISYAIDLVPCRKKGCQLWLEIEDLAGLPDRLLLGLLARSLDELHLGAIRANLGDLRRRSIGRRQDLDAHSTGGAIRRNRCAAIAGAVLQRGIDAELPEIGQHHGGAAILEAAGRVEPFQLEERPEIIPFLLHRRVASFPLRNGSGDLV